MLCLFLVSSPKIPYPILLPLLTNPPTPPLLSGIPLHWRIELSQDQGPPLLSVKTCFVTKYMINFRESSMRC